MYTNCMHTYLYIILIIYWLIIEQSDYIESGCNLFHNLRISLDRLYKYVFDHLLFK